jgi:glycosyltransferase involved in cell wall biosynthesis
MMDRSLLADAGGKCNAKGKYAVYLQDAIMAIKTRQVPESFGSGFASSARYPQPRIRILHSVGHLLRGGIEMWLYQMVQRLDCNRFEHHVLVRTDKEESFTEDFRQAGIRILPCLNHNNPLKYASNLRRVVSQNGPYDILHVHGSNPNGLCALLFAKALGISNRIVHSHNDVRPLLRDRGIVYKSYVGLTLQGLRFFSDRGFAASILAAESMFGDSWQTDRRWELLYYGVNFEPFTEPGDPNLRKDLGIAEDAFVVGHVGRFHPQKNHQFIVRIAEEAVKSDPRVHFLFIGDGDLRAGIAAELERKGLAQNVTFVPDTRSVPKFMLSAMDCFVFPSLYEGLGLVAVEAQAAGLPCFISDRVPREAVVDGSLVRILRLEDPPELWASAILNSKEKRARGGQHLEQFHSSQFNLERCVASLANTYESMAAHPAS